MAPQPPPRSPALAGGAGVQEVMSMVQAVYAGQTLHAVVKLGIPDVLGAEALTAARIAAKLPGDPLVDMVFRSLRFLAASTSFFEEGVDAAGEATFRLSPTGAVLQKSSDALHGWEAQSMAACLLFWLQPVCWQSLGQLPAFLAGKLARDPCSEVSGGKPFHEYLRAQPETVEMQRNFYEGIAIAEGPVIVARYDWKAFRGKTVVEVGECGPSALKSKFPLLNVVHLNLAEIEADGDPMETITFPKADGAILLKHSFSNRSQEATERILRACHEALLEGGKLILMEVVLPEAGEVSKTKGRIILCDIMSALTEGRLRTKSQWEALGRLTGFRLQSVQTTPLPECHLVSFSKA